MRWDPSKSFRGGMSGLEGSPVFAQRQIDLSLQMQDLRGSPQITNQVVRTTKVN